MEPTSVLAYIVPKLVIQAENAVSDCLYFILTAYPTATKSFIGYLNQTGVMLPEDLRFETQIAWEHAGSRPDILGFRKEQSYLVVEAKFNAPLTRRQPIDYIECLPKSGAGILLFIAPVKRTKELWQDLTKRCARSRVSLGPTEGASGALLYAHLQSTHILALASWESLMAKLLHTIPPDADPNPRADLLQLSALCDRLISGNLPPSPALQSVEENDKRDRQLQAIVNKTVSLVVASECATTTRYRATPGPGYYKSYMTLSGRINWCIEYNAEYWARFGQSLIWLTTKVTPYVEADYTALAAKLASSPYRLRDQLLIPLLTTSSHTEDEVAEHMAEQVVSVANMLATSCHR